MVAKKKKKKSVWEEFFWPEAMLLIENNFWKKKVPLFSFVKVIKNVQKNRISEEERYWLVDSAQSCITVESETKWG